MNTKFFFLLLVSLLLTNPTSSIVSKKTTTKNITEIKAASTGKEQMKEPATKENFIWTDDLLFGYQHKNHSGNSDDDDGKFHHFHFNRLYSYKVFRIVLICLSKILLAIIHLCCFLASFAYVL